MKLKWTLGILFSLICVTLVTACISFNKRNVAAVEYDSTEVQKLISDPFTQDGYDHSTTRDFGSSQMSETQRVQELAGRAIWFKSAPNERHHTYIFPQKIGVAIDWNQPFSASARNSRFQTWGLINDPECCTPGRDCDNKKMFYNKRSVSLADTYGWDFCAGDENLLNAVKSGRGAQYRDPACDDPVIIAADHLNGKIRESRCELAFGTSAGAVGFRKYPNPRFNEKRWQKIGGYKGFSEQTIREGINNSVQPPFRVATACASCHAAFDPLNPPADINHPTWANIKGETGNQYLNVSKLMANGMKENDLETQFFTHVRPGAVDTSAVPHDFINNPGTINAIINFPVRPLFTDKVSRWFEVDQCNERDTKNCQKIAYKNESGQMSGYRYWQWQTAEMKVPHILKGGEDSAGYDLAVQRVYVNIGMCSEQCWQNHLTNLREFDATSRGYGESSFNIAQCREQCASFRANEDRTGEILSYLVSRRPTDLKQALQSVSTSTGEKVIPTSPNKALVDAKFKNFLENRYGAGSIERGQQVFANNCARCHSSQNLSDFQSAQFLDTKTLETGEVIRADWLGNDRSTPVGEVGTYKCRALHNNHKEGHVWAPFSSETYKNLPAVTEDAFGQKISGGPGYYRNISLLNVWAHAPFMHNNAIGPEICGQVENSRQVVRTSVEGRQTDVFGKYKCDSYYDPSVKGRLDLYEKSMDELLTPSALRRKKITRLDVPLKFPLGIHDMYLVFPAGMPLNTLANFDIKQFIIDFTKAFGVLSEKDGEKLFKNFWNEKFSDNKKAAEELGPAVRKLIQSLTSLRGILDLNSQIKNQNVETLKVIVKYYRTCDQPGEIENGGHDFSVQLQMVDKQALKAFMATL